MQAGEAQLHLPLDRPTSTGRIPDRGRVTELKRFGHRGHSLTIGNGWTEVADAILHWPAYNGL